jgi:ribosome-binding factor A
VPQGKFFLQFGTFRLTLRHCFDIYFCGAFGKIHILPFAQYTQALTIELVVHKTLPTIHNLFMKTIRQKQVAELVRRNLSTQLLIEGPYIYGREVLVTLTQVIMTPDLMAAKVYLSVFNTESKQEILLLLEENMPRIKTAFAGSLGRQLRRTPEIEFYLDDTIDEMYRVNDLLYKVHTEDKRIAGDRVDPIEEEEDEA